MFILKGKAECYHLKMGSSNNLYNNGGFFRRYYDIKGYLPSLMPYFTMNFMSFKYRRKIDV